MSAHPRLSINQATIKHADPRRRCASPRGAACRRSACGASRSPRSASRPRRGCSPTRACASRPTAAAASSRCPRAPARRAAIDDNRRAIEETATLAAAGARGLDRGARARRGRAARGLPRPHRRARARARRDRRAGAGCRGRRRHARDRAAASDVRLRPGRRLDARAGARHRRGLRRRGRRRRRRHVPHLVGPARCSTRSPAPGARAASRPTRCATGRPRSPPTCCSPRHYPGDGVIDFASLTAAVEAPGYTGDIEVEIFNEDDLGTPGPRSSRRTAEAFGAAVSPHLAATAARVD